MQKQNVNAVRDATASALAAQVKRTLDVMRIRGYVFPVECNVAVKIVRASPLSVDILARIDEVEERGVITPKTSAEDLAAIVDKLVAQWLAKKATQRPS